MQQSSEKRYISTSCIYYLVIVKAASLNFGVHVSSCFLRFSQSRSRAPTVSATAMTNKSNVMFVRVRGLLILYIYLLILSLSTRTSLLKPFCRTVLDYSD